MSEKMLSFQKFNDAALATTIAQTLADEGILCKVVEESPNFDPSYSFNKYDQAFHLKLAPADFDRARVALEAWYASQLDHMDPDYYLFSFTDKELEDLVQHPDEWGPLDYALAKRLLAQRGKAVSADQEANIRTQRLETLAQPEKSSPLLVAAGYFCAVFGGLFGFIIGALLSRSKKNLPNGRQAYMFSGSDRENGKIILIISCIAFPIWIFFKFFR